MKVLITGSSGFLASNLLRNLDNSYKICLTGRKRLHEKYRFLTYDELFASDEKFDVVFHLASFIPNNMLNYDKRILDVNVELTEKLVEKFFYSNFIFSSSVSVCGSNNTIIDEKTSVKPTTLYAQSKLMGETLINKLNNYKIIRFSSIYGEGMNEETFLPRIVNSAIASKKIDVWGLGNREQNYIEVNDASGYLIAALKAKINATFLGVSKKEISNKEMANLICNYVDDVVISFVKEDNSPSFNYNNSWTLNTLNWEPKIDLNLGIKNYVNWKKKQY